MFANQGDTSLQDAPHNYFRPFTRDSLEAIKQRIAKEKIKRKAAKKANKQYDNDAKSCPNPKLAQGMSLPLRLAAAFKPEMANIPLEDIDSFYDNVPTFVVITRRKIIYRFNATKSLWLYSVFNPERRVAIAILTHDLFSFVIAITIISNCVVMSLPSSPLLETTEILFDLIYAFEICVNEYARGLIVGKFTYLRDIWNWLDLIVFTFPFAATVTKIDLRNVRAFRLLRALTVIPGLKNVLDALIGSLKNLRDMTILTMCVLFLLALMGVQLYLGILTQKCIRNFTEDDFQRIKSELADYDYYYDSEEERRGIVWRDWNLNATNWFPHPPPEDFGNAAYRICGNSSGSSLCPENYTCLQGYGESPNYGYTSFNSFWKAFLSTFRIMTLDFWETLYQQILGAAGPWHILYFIAIIFLGSYYLQNLILAIFAMSYDELQKKAEQDEIIDAAEKEAMRAEEELERRAAKTFRNKAAVTQDEPTCARNEQIESTQFPIGGFETIADIKKRDGQSDEILTRENDTNEEGANVKPKFYKEFCRFLNLFCVWECCIPWSLIKKTASTTVFHPFTKHFLTLAIAVNTVFMALDHYRLEEREILSSILRTSNLVFIAIFAVECALKLIAMSLKFYFQDGWNILDFGIVILSLVELIFEDFPGGLQVLRVFKLAKYWPTMNLLITILLKKMMAMANLVFLLFIFIFLLAVIGMQLFAKKYIENVQKFPKGVLPRWNFSSLGNAVMLIFRVMCGEWTELMWDCMLVSGGATCVPFFIISALIGYLIVLNLFLAVLLSSFGASNLRSANSTRYQETNAKQTKAWKQIIKIIVVRLKSTLQFFRASKNSGTVTTKQVDENDTIFEELPQQIVDGDEHALRLVSSSKMSTKNWDKSENRPNKDFEVTQNQECERKTPTPKNKLLRITEICYNYAIILVILVSSVALVFEADAHLPQIPNLAAILLWVEGTFLAVFLLEMCIKWLAFGVLTYFRNAWCLLDFIVVMVSFVNFATTLAGIGGLDALEIVKLLRILRPLQVISRMQGLKVVVTSVVQAIPKIFHVLLVCLVFWLVFAIMGVQLFSGKFYKCINPADHTREDYRIIRNKFECLDNNLTWENSAMNFDHVGNAYLSLLQVATFNGWIEILHDAVDSRDFDEQPHRDASFSLCIYFVIFIIFGSFFTLNLFVGVVIDNFKEETRKSKGSLEMLMTEDQRLYYIAKKKIRRRKPIKPIQKPTWKPKALLFAFVTSKKFEKFILMLIVLNMLILTTYSYKIPRTRKRMLQWVELLLTIIFAFEYSLKILCLPLHYFVDPWNVFDFLILTLSVVKTYLLKHVTQNWITWPTPLRIVRIFKESKGIRTMLIAFYMSLPALFNICLLLFLMMSIFALFGMSFFENVKLEGDLDDVRNFQTFRNSMVLLFQLTTSAGWDSVMAELRKENHEILGIVFILSYLLINFLIVTNMYIAVILENYSQAIDETMKGLSNDHCDMFYETWAPFDPEATQFIKYDQLSDFLDVLEPPLQIRKPNKQWIISKEISIYKEDMMHYVDILDALTKDFFAREGYKTVEINDETLVAPGRPECELVSTTLWRQREDLCANLIQNIWRKRRNNRAKEQHENRLDFASLPKVAVY